MKYPSLLLSLLMVVPAYAQYVEIDSKITKVEVYQGQAKVTRSFEVSVEPGATETLLFKKLPNTAHLDSLQLAVTEGPALYFGQLTRDTVFTPADESEQLQTLRAAVTELEQQRKKLEHQQKLATDQSSHAEWLMVALHGGLRETGNVELYELSKTAGKELLQAQTEALEKQMELQESLRKNEADLKEARRLYQERLTQEQQTAVKLMADATGTARGTSKGEISYVISGASWGPAYVLRAEPKAKQLEVVYQGRVWQSSGEDWDAVRLTLHTGSPTLGGAPVEPNPVFLAKWEPSRKGAANEDGFILSPFEVSVDQRGYLATRQVSGTRVDRLVTEVSASYSGFEAVLPGAVTIRTGKPAVVLPILTETAEGEFWTVAIPRTSETAFLSTKFENPFQLPLLPGNVQLMVDGAMTGYSAMEHTLPEQDVEIGLGQNQNIKIERVTLAEDRGRKGIIGKSRVEERRYETKVTNNMGVEQRVVIKDLAPISRDDKIKVEVKSPRNARVDPETGLFEWEVTLKPGQSETLLTHFVVTYPEDWQVDGEF